jgi:hypothetical protein
MRLRNVLLTSAATLLCAASLSANASSVHTWVSGATGNDSTGNGTRAKPYATFSTAAANTLAGGVISVADPGDFGPLTITQSVTIDGENMGSIGFAGDGEGIFINGSGSVNVVLRNLTIDGQGTGSDGIFFEGQGNLTIDNCRIEGFTQIGIGIGSTASENVLVTNTVIDGANVGTLGFRVFQGAGPDVVALDHVTIKGMTNAAVFNRSGVLQVTNSVITQSNIGVQADTAAIVSVANTAITSNQVGVCSYTTSKIRLDTNDIYDNPTAIEECGGTIKTSGTNRTSGAINISPTEVTNTVLF